MMNETSRIVRRNENSSLRNVFDSWVRTFVELAKQHYLTDEYEAEKYLWIYFCEDVLHEDVFYGDYPKGGIVFEMDNCALFIKQVGEVDSVDLLNGYMHSAYEKVKFELERKLEIELIPWTQIKPPNEPRLNVGGWIEEYYDFC